MNARYGLVLLAALVCATVDTGSAQAQYGLNAGCGYGYGAWDMGRLYGVLAQNVPHYAAFPPVYYSAPVPRTYGYSPFAYPPGYATPDLAETPKALEISNPYVKPAAESKPQKSVDKVTRATSPRPLLVENPYVHQHVALAE
jgi:hypothetical protein